MTDKHLDLELVKSMYGTAWTKPTTYHTTDKMINRHCVVLDDEKFGFIAVIFFVDFLIVVVGIDVGAVAVAASIILILYGICDSMRCGDRCSGLLLFFG